MAAAKSNTDEAVRDVQQGVVGGDFVSELIRHQRRIYAFIGSLVHQQADIEDLYQQTDPFPVSIPALMRELGNSPRGVSEGGA